MIGTPQFLSPVQNKSSELLNLYVHLRLHFSMLSHMHRECNIKTPKSVILSTFSSSPTILQFKPEAHELSRLSKKLVFTVCILFSFVFRIETINQYCQFCLQRIPWIWQPLSICRKLCDPAVQFWWAPLFWALQGPLRPMPFVLP